VSSVVLIGLTGGIGSGKSAVCREFERLGVPIVDADIVSREVVEPGSDGLRAVVEFFGDEILDSQGLLDRARLRQLIFDDEEKRVTLESILHPKIHDRIREQLDAIETPYSIMCVPLLVEKHGYENIDRILVVDCPVEIQILRVMKRDNLTRERVGSIMRTQATREQRLRLADDIVENASGIESLRKPVQILHDKYTTIAQQLKSEPQANAKHRDRSPKQPVSRG
jgi:dephospho-CoA kinase